MRNKVIKLLVLVCGSAVMGIGVAFAIRGGQGTDPLASFWEGLSNHLPLSVGQINIFVNAVLLVITLFIDKKQINLGTIVNPIVSGISLDIILMLQDTDNLFLLSTVQSLIGVMLLGIGVGIYTSADIGKGAYDALTFSVSEKFNIPYFKIRMIWDLFFLIMGYLLGAKFGIATIVSVFCLGYVIQFTNKLFFKLLKQYNVMK